MSNHKTIFFASFIQEDAKKFIKICNARTQPSFLLITLFVDVDVAVAVAVAVVVSSGSLKPPQCSSHDNSI